LLKPTVTPIPSGDAPKERTVVEAQPSKTFLAKQKLEQEKTAAQQANASKQTSSSSSSSSSPQHPPAKSQAITPTYQPKQSGRQSVSNGNSQQQQVQPATAKQTGRKNSGGNGNGNGTPQPPRKESRRDSSSQPDSNRSNQKSQRQTARSTGSKPTYRATKQGEADHQTGTAQEAQSINVQEQTRKPTEPPLGTGPETLEIDEVNRSSNSSPQPRTEPTKKRYSVQRQELHGASAVAAIAPLHPGSMGGMPPLQHMYPHMRSPYYVLPGPPHVGMIPYGPGSGYFMPPQPYGRPPFPPHAYYGPPPSTNLDLHQYEILMYEY